MFNSLSLVLFATACYQTPQVPAHFKAVTEIVGKPGTLNADGSYRINIARTDVKFKSASGMPLPADLGLATYLALSGTQQQSFAVGDFAMLEGEIDGVVNALRDGNFEIVSLHNHLTGEEPRLYFLHFQATGVPTELARTFRKAFDVLEHGTKKIEVTAANKPKLDPDALGAIFAAKAQVFPSGVVRFSSPRKDIGAVLVDGQSFLPGMGLASWAAFNPCDCGKTMVMGDTCCLRSELQPAIDALRKSSIRITAIHNHVLGGSREISFLHYEGEGDSLALAKGVKSCWDVLGKTN